MPTFEKWTGMKFQKRAGVFLALDKGYRPRSCLQQESRWAVASVKNVLRELWPDVMMVGFSDVDYAFASITYKGGCMSSLFQDGINFFNSGRYFEAHEAWEEMWRREAGPLRVFYQGLVQAAVGLHHLNRANDKGGKAVLQRSITKLRQYPEELCGINNRKLVDALEKALQGTHAGAVRIEAI